MIYLKTNCENFPHTSNTGKENSKTSVQFLFLFLFAIVNLTSDIYYFYKDLYAKFEYTSITVIVHIVFDLLHTASEFRFILEFGAVSSVYMSIADQLSRIAHTINEKNIIERKTNE